MPISPTYPGVYVEELPSTVRTITGVSTSVTAFLGRAYRGPMDEAILIHSFADYERIFGGLWKPSSMSYAVNQCFQNGGKDALIVRVFHVPDHTAANKYDPFMSTINVGSISLRAANPGKWSKNLGVTVKHRDKAENEELFDEEQNIPPVDTSKETLFDLEVKEIIGTTTIVLESFINLSTKPNSPRFIGRTLEKLSDNIRLASPLPPDTITERPAQNTYTVSANGAEGGDDDNIEDDDVVENLQSLKRADIFNLLCIPPLNPGTSTSDSTDVSPSTYKAALSFLETEQRRTILICDSPKDWKSKDDVLNNINTPDFLGLKNKNAVIFFPRIKAPDPLDENRSRVFACCGAVSGVIGRTDVERGIWKAPAGTDATINAIDDLTVSLTDLENGDLNQRGVNCLRVKPPYGILVWGSRTLRGDDAFADQWKYISVRRVALHIEESLFRGTQWVVFEPNDEPLWAQIRLNVGAFMHDLFIKGAFQGTDPKKAYFVKCDGETTTQQDIDRGIVNIVVGFAPLKPAEFVILKIIQHTVQAGGVS